MKGRVGVWWVPLLLLVAPLVDQVPTHRDLVEFFAPMRAHTAAELRAGRVPWLNPANGCGEAWYSNPETGVLYPPHLIYLVLPLDWALTAEVGLHLTWLALGAGLVARRMGADRWGRLVAEAVAFSAGPVLTLVGVVNNLDGLAWVPWMVLSAGVAERRAVSLLALATAAGWLAGEPQVWAVGVGLTLLSRPVWRTVAGLALGIGLVAIQLVPFMLWVAEGDRGPATATAVRGALPAGGWLGVLAPSAGATAGTGLVFAESLFLGAPLLLCILLGVGRRWWGLLLVAAAMAGLATLPTVGGGRVYELLTLGLVRYPGRFALLAVAVLLPLAGPGWVRFAAGEGRRLAVALAAGTIVLCVLRPSDLTWLAAGVPALVLLGATASPARRWLPGAAVAAGVAGTVLAGWPLLEVKPSSTLARRGTAWPEAAAGGRLYTRPETPQVSRWLASSAAARRLWPVGYVNLGSGVELARSHAPILHHRLVAHLSEVDRGPAARWWLDVMAARWMLLTGSAELPGLEPVQSRGGLVLHRNRRANPVVTLGSEEPRPGRGWRAAGGIVTLRGHASQLVAVTRCDRPSVLWLGVPPVRGWSWRLDGAPVVPVPGPGILQWLPMEAGAHRVEGRYRAPLLGWAGCVCAVAWLVVAIQLLRDFRQRPSSRERRLK